MNDGREELSQFVLNRENSPLDCVLAAVRFFKMNTARGPKIAADLEKLLRDRTRGWADEDKGKEVKA